MKIIEFGTYFRGDAALLSSDSRPSSPRMALLVESRVDEELRRLAWSYLETHPRELFASPSWLRLSPSTVEELLRRSIEKHRHLRFDI